MTAQFNETITNYSAENVYRGIENANARLDVEAGVMLATDYTPMRLTVRVRSMVFDYDGNLVKMGTMVHNWDMERWEDSAARAYADALTYAIDTIRDAGKTLRFNDRETSSVVRDIVQRFNASADLYVMTN